MLFAFTVYSSRTVEIAVSLLLVLNRLEHQQSTFAAISLSLRMKGAFLDNPDYRNDSLEMENLVMMV